MLPAAVPAQAADLPGPATGFQLETGGLGTPLSAGDWYTSAAGGAARQVYQITIPCDWPSSEPVYIDLFSPEINRSASTSDTVSGSADTVRFTLTSPTGAIVADTLWQPAPIGDPERYYPWATIAPADCGTYTVRTWVQLDAAGNPTGGNDDQNSWLLRAGSDNDVDVTNPPPANYDDYDLVPGTGDEITVGIVRGSFESAAGGCLTLYEYVRPGSAGVTFRNFGMGGAGSVTYYAPSDTYDPTGAAGGITGTVSATEDTWASDTIPTPESGWWAIVTCVPGGNQFIQEGQTSAPAYLEQPGEPTLSVTVDDGQTLVSRGQSLTWTATVSNTSSGATAGAASGVTLTAALPAGMTGGSCVVLAPATGTCSVSGGTATATLSGTLDAGSSATIRITSTVAPTASGPLPMSVAVAYQDPIGNPYASATAADTDTSVRSSDLTVTVTDSPDPVVSSGTLTYTVRVANAGPDEATAVSTTFTLGSGLSFGTASGTGWTCGAPAGQTVTCTRPTLASGASAAFTVTATATATSGTVTSTATATTTAADPTTPSSGSASTTVVTIADLRLAKAHIGSFQHGQLGFYELTATNDGPSPTSGPVTITDTLPAGLTYVSATGSGWACSATGQVVTCTRADGLVRGQTSSVTLIVDVTTATAANITNTASVSGPDTDDDPSDNTASDPTAVETASIGDLVWDDLNGDGIRQAGEPGLAGLTVTAVGPVTRTTTTSSTGAYRFVGLLPGTYQVTVTGPAKYVATTANPRTVTITSGEQVTSADFGFRYANQAPVVVNDSATTAEDARVTLNVVANDSDPDGDSFAVTGSTNGVNGTVTCTATSCTYTPAPDTFGTDTFTYTVSDPDGATATATVTVTVTPVNDAPSYTAAAANTSQTIPVNGTLSSLAATDPDGDPLSFTLTGGALPPGVTLNANGSFTGGATAPGSYSATVTVSDGFGGTAVTTLAVQVGGPTANTPPSPQNDAITVPEDGSVDAPVLANDTDVDLDALVVTGSTQGTKGTVSCDADSCVYTPNPNANGSDTFTYTVFDGTASASATVTVTITAVNDAPTYTSAPTNTSQTVPVFGTLSSLAATDIDGDPLTYTLVGGALPPGVTLNSNGSFTGGATAPGTYSATIQVSDGKGGTATTVLGIQVGGPTANTPPEANPDTQTVGEDTVGSTGVTANDTDVDLDTLTITGWTQGTFGAVTCSGGSCTYTPSANFNGSDTYTYTVSDGSGGTDTTSVAVTVTPVNDPPAFTGATRNTSQTIPVGGTLQSLQATDIEGDGLSYSLVGGALPGGITLNPSGTFSGTANGPGTFSAQIQVSDGNGGTAVTTLNVGVGGPAANTPPAASDDAQTVAEDGSVSTDVVANDTDVDLDTLSIVGSTNGSFGLVSCANRTCTYTPNANFNGSDSYTYTVTDGLATDTAVVVVTVTPVNDAPMAGNDSRTTAEDAAITMTMLLGNDTDIDNDALTISSFTQPANGTVTCGVTACTYTPDANFNGSDTFTYTVSDGNGGSDTALVTMTVTAVNDDPVADDEAATVAEDASVVVSVLTGDTDVEGDALSVSGFTQGSFGSVSCTATACTYTPDANFNGSDTFTYTVSDGNGGSDTATVSVTVTPVNDAPVALDDSGSTDEDTAVSIDVRANDSDLDGDPLTITSWSQGSNGSVTCAGSTCTYTPDANFNGVDSFFYEISDGAGGTALASVSVAVGAVNDVPVADDDTMATTEDNAATVDVVVNDTDTEGTPLTISGFTQGANGTVTCGLLSCTYTPNRDFNGTDSFSYTVTDGELTDTATVVVTVTAVNDLPVADDDSITTTEDRPGSVDVLDGDTDIDGDPLTVVAWTDGVNGTVSCAGRTCTYLPAADFNGTDSFTYTVSDGAGGTHTATVTVTVTGQNDAPVPGADVVTTDEDMPVGIDVLGNDRDVDGDALTVTAWTDGARGTVTCTATACLYAPAPDANGIDSFTYTVSDGNGGTATGTVTVSVNPVNDAPVAVADAATTTEDTPILLEVVANDTDTEDDALEITGFTQGASGTVACTVTACLYTPAPDTSGVDSFSYTVSDGNGGTSTTTVTVTVTPVPDAPLAVADTATVAEDARVVIAVLDNDTDNDDDPLTVTGFTQGTSGTVSCTASACTYVPRDDFNGVDSFTYTVSDGTGRTSKTTVTVTVTPVNDAPVAGADSAVVVAGDSVTFPVLDNDDDVDGDTLRVVSYTQPTHGSVTCTAAGRCTYTAVAGYAGADSFTYTVSDGHGGTDVRTVRLTVRPRPAPPARPDGQPPVGPNPRPGPNVGSGGLGNTGADTGPLAAAGLLAVVGGSLLLAAGARPARRRRSATA